MLCDINILYLARSSLISNYFTIRFDQFPSAYPYKMVANTKKRRTGDMNYSEFLDYVKSSIIKILGKEKNVNISKILKTNDIEYDALTITDDISNISPTIYLNQYYDDYKNGKSLGDIIHEIFSLYEEHSNELEFDIELFKNFQNISSHIVYKVINAKKNMRLLNDIPHVLNMDLALVFYCIIDSDYLGSATALIHNSHMDMWNVTTEDIVKVSYQNTPRILPAEIRNMNDIIREMFASDLQRQQIEGKIPMDISVEDEADKILDTLNMANKPVEMYVLTNSQKMYGAACIFYKNVLKDFAEKVKSDLYILPSSVHEVILVPIVDGLLKNELSLMVQDVNREEVTDSEVLSNHVYIYKRNIDKIVT